MNVIKYCSIVVSYKLQLGFAKFINPSAPVSELMLYQKSNFYLSNQGQVDPFACPALKQNSEVYLQRISYLLQHSVPST